MVPAIILGILLSLLSTLGLGLSTQCWWPFYTIGILAIAGILAGIGWVISQAFTATAAGATSWWQSNRWRVLQALLAALVVLTILWLVAIWAKKMAPSCQVGCLGVGVASAETSTPSPSEGAHTLTFSPGKPAEVRIPVGWRWDLADGPVPQGWVTESRMEAGILIQTFKVDSPSRGEVKLNVKVSKCTTKSACAW